MEFAFAGACDYDTRAVSRTEICAFPRPPGAAALPGGRRTESAHKMTPQFRHWLEKAHVQAAAAAALAFMWFVGWRLVQPEDPQSALTFIPTGHYACFAVFAALVLAFAVGCALVTLPARPEGALLATLVGAAGLSLRSAPMRTVLWQFPDPRWVFLKLAVEALLMVAVLFAAAAVILLVRSVFRRLAPRWVWKEQPEQLSGGDEQPGGQGRPSEPGEPATTLRAGAARAGACLLMEMAAATVLLVLTFRSPDRGQIAFALAGSFFLSALIAHQTFPARAAAACWLGPVVMAVAVFALGYLVADYPDQPTWHAALLVAQNLPLRAALPVDWMTLGGAGAVGGFWLSRRFHYARLHHGQENQKTTAEKS